MAVCVFLYMISIMNSTVALRLLITILVIANVSNPGLAQSVLCCRLRLPCCFEGRLEREPNAAVQQPATGALKDSPRSNLVSPYMN